MACAPRPDFTAEERARILAHGPWPPAATRDPSNRVSGNPDAIDLGRRLFSDSALSRSGYIGCVTCHQPDRALTDLRARAHGIADVDRNTPTRANLRLQRWFGWGGASDSRESRRGNASDSEYGGMWFSGAPGRAA